MEVRRYISPRWDANVRARMRVRACLCVDKCVKECYRQSMQGGNAFPLECPLSLITSDYRLLERDDQPCPATELMT